MLQFFFSPYPRTDGMYLCKIYVRIYRVLIKLNKLFAFQKTLTENIDSSITHFTVTKERLLRLIIIVKETISTICP